MLTREEADFIAVRLRRGGELDVFWDTKDGHEVVIVGLPNDRFGWELFINAVNSSAPVPTRTGNWNEDQLIAFLFGLAPGARYVLSSVRPRGNGPRASFHTRR